MVATPYQDTLRSMDNTTLVDEHERVLADIKSAPKCEALYWKLDDVMREEGRRLWEPTCS